MIADSLCRRLRQARHVAVFTGAGMSAESGVPTFRDRFEGLWAHTDPQEVATPEAFRGNPQRVWDWHVYLADTIRRAAPNRGHRAIAQLEGKVARVSVLTQNIDSLHQSAGSREVVELHGNLFKLKPFIDEEAAFADGRRPVICPVCDGYAEAERCDPYAGREDMAALSLQAGAVPRCPGCGALLRPGVVWFGEMLEPQVLADAWDAAGRCDALFCIGSSLEVEPAASLPWRALDRGAAVIEVNPQPTALSRLADLSLRAAAAEVLPRLFEQVWGIDAAAEPAGEAACR